jgi:hypothetical protein
MRRSLAFVLLTTLIPLAPAAEDGSWKESLLLKEGLRHSDIALMPEGTPKDYALFALLRPPSTSMVRPLK